MKFEKEIKNLAKQLNKTVVFPEANVSDYIVEAAKYLTKKKLVNVILLGDESSLVLRYKNLKNITIINPKTSDISDELAKVYYEKRKHKGITLDDAYSEILDPICFGALLVYVGIADCMVAGAETTTKKVIKRCLEVLKLEESNFVSSCMVISGKNSIIKDQKAILLADCALNINPDKEQIKKIALQTALTAKYLDIEPKIAMLSYSTNGSAGGESAEKIRLAAADLKKDLDLLVEGEMQLDAAISQRVLNKKFRGSRIKGTANVLIFPDLQSGNIAYKAIEYFGHLNAYGPILQGLSRPVADLSRGASVKEIVHTTLITVVLCEWNKFWKNACKNCLNVVIYPCETSQGIFFMTVDTKNYYGRITISDNSIAVVAGYAALDCYGVVDLVSNSFKDSFAELFKKQRYSRGVKISSVDSRIFIDIYCIFKYGVSVSAVAESLKSAVKYSVENFTGMIVDTVNVHVVGVRV